MSGEYYFVTETSSLSHTPYICVGTFYACTTKPSSSPYFGGVMIDEMDSRNLMELKKCTFVSGLWMKEKVL